MKSLSERIVVSMIQESTTRWCIKSPKGFVIVDNITLGNVHKAKEYIERYVSSFLNWEYEIVPMQEKSKK